MLDGVESLLQIVQFDCYASEEKDDYDDGNCFEGRRQ
jgi:hypothetical protein